MSLPIVKEGAETLKAYPWQVPIVLLTLAVGLLFKMNHDQSNAFSAHRDKDDETMRTVIMDNTVVLRRVDQHLSK